jgi:hypothetical protein
LWNRELARLSASIRQSQKEGGLKTTRKSTNSLKVLKTTRTQQNQSIKQFPEGTQKEQNQLPQGTQNDHETTNSLKVPEKTQKNPPTLSGYSKLPENQIPESTRNSQKICQLPEGGV